MFIYLFIEFSFEPKEEKNGCPFIRREVPFLAKYVPQGDTIVTGHSTSIPFIIIVIMACR